MNTLTTTQETAIRDWLTAHPALAVGVGTTEQACSVAAINLALTGTLTDMVPDCMSPVIGHWMIGIQDHMPDGTRNSAAWRDLLPLAAGTGRAHETERLAIVMDWMWGTAMPLAQSVADARGFGTEWRAMCTERTDAAADAATLAAAFATFTVEAATDVATAANAAANGYGAIAAGHAASAAARVAYAVADAVYFDHYVTNADDDLAYTTMVADSAAASADAVESTVWRTLDPVGLLRRLVAVTDGRVAAE